MNEGTKDDAIRFRDELKKKGITAIVPEKQ